MSRRLRVAQKSAARARVAWAKVLRRRARATRTTRAATAATAAALTLAGAGTAFAAPHEGSGTVAGTAAGSDASPAACPTPRPSSAPRFAAAIGSTVFFTANDGVHGRELWKSDGTAAGTVLVKDISPNRFSSGPEYLTALDGELFFAARDGVHGRELWKSDGSTAGTVMVKDIATGNAPGDPYTPASGAPSELTVLNGRLLFAADDGIHGRELWTSDGSTAGTVLVKDIAASSSPGDRSSYPSGLTVVGSRVLFSADDGTHGRELWKSDGSQAGTVLVKDINRRETEPEYPGSNPFFLTAVGDRLFFAANDDIHGYELWKSDGSRTGTVLVRDIDTTGSGYRGSSTPSYLAEMRGQLFFAAHDDTHGRELWKSDGSRAGTVMVKNINSAPGNEYGPAGGDPSSLTTVGRRLFFDADDGRHGRELWTSTGSRAGTVLVKDINPSGDSTRRGYGYGPSSSLAAVGGRLLFTATDGTHGRELWRSDGSRAGTVLVKDIRSCSGPGGSPEFLTAVDGRMFLSADDGVHGRELWTSDGSRAGTVLVKDINPVTTP